MTPPGTFQWPFENPRTAFTRRTRAPFERTTSETHRIIVVYTACFTTGSTSSRSKIAARAEPLLRVVVEEGLHLEDAVGTEVHRLLALRLERQRFARPREP